MSDTDWRELERAAGAPTPRYPEPGLGTLWFSMHGRISRSTYWLKFFLPMIALEMVGAVADGALGTLPADGGFGPFTAVMCLGVLYPSLVGAVKRLHDLGHPGWFVLVFYGGCFIGGVLSGILGAILGPGAALVALVPAFILFLCSIWFSLRMAFARGTVGPNRFGRDPLGVRWEPRAA